MLDWSAVLHEFPLSSPAPAGQAGRIPLLEVEPKVVLFDIYGTLLCPDPTRQVPGADSFVGTAERFGFPRQTGRTWHEWFFEAVADEQEEMRKKGVIPAEVQVDLIWETMIVRSARDKAVAQPRTLAAYREMLANPVRAFAGAVETLRNLKNAGIRLGIVSNCQFYTMPILGYTLDIKPGDFFERELTFLSYRLGFAKPAPYFFRLVRTTLLHKGFREAEALVVGNDCENDILPAQAQGLQAILFHGNEKAVRPCKPGHMVNTVWSYESLLAACGV